MAFDILSYLMGKNAAGSGESSGGGRELFVKQCLVRIYNNTNTTLSLPGVDFTESTGLALVDTWFIEAGNFATSSVPLISGLRTVWAFTTDNLNFEGDGCTIEKTGNTFYIEFDNISSATLFITQKN